MAGEDDNIGLSLPQPPPPAPARRDAAIQEAMRRFDARGEPSSEAPIRPEPQRVGSWWSKVNRPQLGILVAASLVAVIGLPLAWLTVSQKTTPATELASRDIADLKTFDVEEAPPPAAMSAPKPPAIAFEPPMVAPPPIVAPGDDEAHLAESAISPAQASATAKRDPPSMLAEGKSARDANTAGGRRDTMLAQADITASPAMSAPAAPAAAPPPLPLRAEGSAATKSREELADSRDVIVTAARRRGRPVPERGNWNACTIDDPRRSLAACKSLINPGAKGIKGQAATRLADGLSLAWQGNIERAIAAFDQAIAINPKSSLAYLNRGLAWRQKGDGNRALTDLDQAVKLAPNAARGYYNRGLLLRERGDDRRARADQTHAVDLDPDYEAVID
jgi:hypothetical protein